MKLFLAIAWTALCCTGLTALAQDGEAEGVKSELEVIKKELETLKAEYAEKIARLEQRLDQLEASSAAAQPTQFTLPPTTESSAPVGQAAGATFSGGERTLQGLNPEISVTGDFTGRLSDNRADDEFNRFNFDGFEMALQHPLDPYSLAKFFVTFEDGEFSLEEGYISYEALPGRLGLKAGRFHSDFGKLNRYHKHALPWVDRDLPTRTFFGEEGLIGTGASLTWLPPKLPIADTNEFFFEIINNDNDQAFSGRGFADPLLVGRVLSYYDLSQNAYFEWGASAATAHWDEGKQNRSTVYGLDLAYRWQPLRQALYRSFELRGQLYYNDRRNSPGGNPFGMFASGEYQLSRRWFAGLRYQYAEELEDSAHSTRGFSPFLSFWQSEFVRIRGQYDFLDNHSGENENRFFLQLTWSLGPHKHEAY